MVIRAILLAGLLLTAGSTYGQFWKSKKKTARTENAGPTSLDPTYAQKEYAPKVERKASKGRTYNLEEEYYERVVEVAKARRKTEKLMEKPQYSDPLYFGHKRPPKKRKPSKMKYCKECGIRH